MKREEEAQSGKKKKRIFINKSETIGCSHYLRDLLVQSLRIKPWVEEGPMKPGSYSRMTSSKQEDR